MIFVDGVFRFWLEEEPRLLRGLVVGTSFYQENGLIALSTRVLHFLSFLRFSTFDSVVFNVFSVAINS